MNNQNLNHAIEAYKRGDKNKAGEILSILVKQEPKNEIAWLWLAACVSTDEKRELCLNKVIQINPNNEKAKLALEKIRSNSEPSIDELASQIREDISISPSVQFIPAICPNCGGELRVPENKDIIKCMYCGYDIIVHDKNHIVVEEKSNTENLLILADTAEKAKNYEDAYRYYSQVLEKAPGNSIAWIGKGFCAGMQCSVNLQRILEAITCIKKGVEKCKGEEEINLAARAFAEITLAYTISVEKHVKYECMVIGNNRHIEDKDPFTRLLGRGFGDSFLKYFNEMFVQQYQDLILQSITYAWQLNKGYEVADFIYKALYTIEASSVLVTGTKDAFRQKLQPILSDMKKEFPDKIIPVVKRDDCFIATATMNDYDHPYVIILRKFRDNMLLNNIYGTLFIKAYYQISPPLAKLIKNSIFLRKLSLYFLIIPSVIAVKRVLYRK